ncbi:MAG: ATP-binding cassette domain-containing protein [Clostridium sp.]|nr:ATP-binding cassette domain-containing protein [Clostridium sp.]
MPNEAMKQNGQDETLLRVEHLCQYFGSNKAVDDVSFDVKRGEVFGLVGESGCGKTTTGRSIIRLYDITSGNIYFKGKRIAAGTKSYRDNIKEAKKRYQKEVEASKKQGAAASSALEEKKKQLDEYVAEQRALMKSARYDHKNCNKMYAGEALHEVEEKYGKLIAQAQGAEKTRLEKEFAYERKIAKKQKFITKIQMIFQDPIASLDPRMTVGQIIAEGLVIRGETDKKKIDQKVYEVLELVGLVREHAGRYPHEFSGGQRQRIGVARAVIMNPEMIIADEPVSALDVSIQAQVINLLDDLRHQMGLTVLFIAHDLSVVKYFSDRIGVMYYGKMVELATSEELFAHPFHPYTRSLLSAIPMPDPDYEKQRKRITYEPLKEHDYTVDKPSFREVSPGHFVYCNEEEFKRYQEQL